VISNAQPATRRVNPRDRFLLTEAVRPAAKGGIIPRQGYRTETFHDISAGINVPVLAAAVSADQLFDIFLAMLDPLGEQVDVVLETSHENLRDGHQDLFREGIDLPVLLSHFCDFEDLLVNDGCTGVAVIATEEPIELQFDEHKLLVVYARDIQPFQQILQRAGIRRDDRLKLISEGEHLHLTDPRYQNEFEQLARRICVGERTGRVSW
jgi:hypothetical protein